jgi:hypothetical protein
MTKPDLVGGVACGAAILFSFGAAASAAVFFQSSIRSRDEQGRTGMRARMPNRPAGSAVVAFLYLHA